MRHELGHSLLTYGWFTQPTVILECGEWHGGCGQGRWSDQCYICLDLDRISPLIHDYMNAKASGEE